MCVNIYMYVGGWYVSKQINIFFFLSFTNRNTEKINQTLIKQLLTGKEREWEGAKLEVNGVSMYFVVQLSAWNHVNALHVHVKLNQKCTEVNKEIIVF